MGLGKTLSILALILKSAEQEGDIDEDDQYTSRNTKRNGGNNFLLPRISLVLIGQFSGSLIVCPASLINQWSGEIDKRIKRGLLSYYMFHGPKRENSAKKLAKYDVVRLTTNTCFSVTF